MTNAGGLRRLQIAPLAERSEAARPEGSGKGVSYVARTNHSRRIYQTAWYAGNTLLVLMILVAMYSAVWEYSTRRYLKGFSDAIVPESSSAEEKADAIVNWMANGPSRLQVGPYAALADRDPTETLNFASLLQICGSATNAFINLAESSGLPSRRLLLIDDRHSTKHVVAEVLVDGRWIIVDPAFRVMFRGSEGQPLTREELTEPAVFSFATQNVAGYNPTYTYDRTVHVRLARLGFVGPLLRSALDHLLPGWSDSTSVSLLLERDSMATLVMAIILVLLLCLVRVGLRWYGERRLGIYPVRLRHQVRRAFQALLDTTG